MALPFLIGMKFLKDVDFVVVDVVVVVVNVVVVALLVVTDHI